MTKTEHGGANNVAKECSEYEPIQVVSNLAMDYGEKELEDAGCDSCVHSNNGDCDVYVQRH